MVCRKDLSSGGSRVAQERLLIGVAGGGEAGHSAFLAELAEHEHSSAVRVQTA
jgi:hypothetical protein